MSMPCSGRAPQMHPTFGHLLPRLLPGEVWLTKCRCNSCHHSHQKVHFPSFIPGFKIIQRAEPHSRQGYPIPSSPCQSLLQFIRGSLLPMHESVGKTRKGGQKFNEAFLNISPISTNSKKPFQPLSALLETAPLLQLPFTRIEILKLSWALFLLRQWKHRFGSGMASQPNAWAYKEGLLGWETW